MHLALIQHIFVILNTAALAIVTARPPPPLDRHSILAAYLSNPPRFWPFKAGIHGPPLRPRNPAWRVDHILKGMWSICMSRVELISGAVIGAWKMDEEGAQDSISCVSSLWTAFPFPRQGYHDIQFIENPAPDCRVLGRGRTNKAVSNTEPSFQSHTSSLAISVFVFLLL